MNKPLILVVEDDTAVRNLITTTLKAHDYRYLTAANGESAVLEATSHNPDVILLDLGLPDLDGVEVIRRVRSWSNLPIIVISARSEDTDKIDALDAGADYAGNQDLIQKIQGENWFEFDTVIATPDMMGTVGRLGKLLGPKGLMPSPKAGTVTPDIARAVSESKAGKIEYRLDKTNIIHCPIGKVSFGPEKLVDNYTALIGAIIKAKPAAAKGQYIRSCVTASTMGPGVKINANKQA